MLYDITPPIVPGMPVWPGDTRPEREVLLDMRGGDNLTLSTLRSTVHVGAHADGPNHYGIDAADIASRSLEYYLGRCQVMKLAAVRRSRVAPEMLTEDITTPRVLLATGTFPDPSRWNDDFAALAPELVDFLADRGVMTIGIDTPSVDLQESKDLPTHQRFLARDLAILEGLDLAAVPPGEYELIALPLRLAGFDASPLRAVLRTV